MEYNTFSIYSTRKELFSKEKSINLDNEKSNQNKIKYILQLILSRGINEKLEKKICCCYNVIKAIVIFVTLILFFSKL